MGKKYRTSDAVRIEAAHAAAHAFNNANYNGTSAELWSLCVFFELFILGGPKATREFAPESYQKRKKQPTAQVIHLVPNPVVASAPAQSTANKETTTVAKPPKNFAAFEKSGADKDKGMKEGSKKDNSADKKQFKAFQKGGKPKK